MKMHCRQRKSINLHLFGYLCVIPVILFTGSILADELSFFSPQDDVNYHIKRAINQSRRSIDLAVSDIKSSDIADGLIDARNRGVAIRIMIYKRPQREADSQIQRLIEGGFKFKVFEAPDTSLHNFAIFDGKLLLGGAFYMSDEKYQNITFTDNADSVDQYRHRFDKLVYEAYDLESLAEGGVPQPDSTGLSETSLPAADRWSGVGEVSESFEDINKLFGRDSVLSKGEKKRRWDEYKGKYVTWSGNITYVAWGMISGTVIGVMHKGNEEVTVQLEKEYTANVKRLHKGDPITYKGRLVKIPSRFAGFKVKDAIVIK